MHRRILRELIDHILRCMEKNTSIKAINNLTRFIDQPFAPMLGAAVGIPDNLLTQFLVEEWDRKVEHLKRRLPQMRNKQGAFLLLRLSLLNKATHVFRFMATVRTWL